LLAYILLQEQQTTTDHIEIRRGLLISVAIKVFALYEIRSESVFTVKVSAVAAHTSTQYKHIF